MLEYWSPTHFSGLFDTSEAAPRDALEQLPWLAEERRHRSSGYGLSGTGGEGLRESCEGKPERVGG